MDGNDLIERLMGGRTPEYGKQHGHLRCDTCLSEIHAPADIGLYASTRDIIRGNVPLQFRVTFCESCRPDAIPVHTRGAVDILLHSFVADEGGLPRLEDARVIETGKSDHGRDWNPGNVWESVTGIPARQMANGMAERGSALTPGHIWGFFLAMGIDVGDIIGDDGNLSVSSDCEIELRETARGYLLSLGESGRVLPDAH